MPIVLIGKDKALVESTGGHLTRGGAGPLTALDMREVLDGRKAVGDADLIFLVLPAQDFLGAGEAVSRIRQGLGEGQKLILCITPIPYKDQRLRLLSYGAAEIISPAGTDAERIAERILAHLIQKQRIKPYNLGRVLGATRVMQEVYDLVRQYAPLDMAVLLRGETGTGKGFLAQELHNETRRQAGRRGEFVHIHCTALNPGSVEAELFGHVKGSFTGALADRKGLVEEAHQGSLLVDEIGDFDSGLQVKLLDLVENKRVRRLGSNKFTEVDVRFIFATHRPLERFVKEGKFREDLLARINELPLELPPLRRRKADIPLLVEHFLDEYNERYKRKVTLGGGAVDELFNCDWRLNVRGLRSVVRQAAASAGADGVITNFILPESDRAPAAEQPHEVTEATGGDAVGINPLKDSWPALHGKVRATYFRELAACSESMQHASKLSHIGRTQLYDIFREYGLHIGVKSARPKLKKEDEGEGQPD